MAGAGGSFHDAQIQGDLIQRQRIQNHMIDSDMVLICTIKLLDFTSAVPKPGSALFESDRFLRPVRKRNSGDRHRCV